MKINELKRMVEEAMRDVTPSDVSKRLLGLFKSLLKVIEEVKVKNPNELTTLDKFDVQNILYILEQLKDWAMNTFAGHNFGVEVEFLLRKWITYFESNSGAQSNIFGKALRNDIVAVVGSLKSSKVQISGLSVKFYKSTRISLGHFSKGVKNILRLISDKMDASPEIKESVKKFYEIEENRKDKKFIKFFEAKEKIYQQSLPEDEREGEVSQEAFKKYFGIKKYGELIFKEFKSLIDTNTPSFPNNLRAVIVPFLIGDKKLYNAIRKEFEAFTQDIVELSADNLAVVGVDYLISFGLKKMSGGDEEEGEEESTDSQQAPLKILLVPRQKILDALTKHFFERYKKSGAKGDGSFFYDFGGGVKVDINVLWEMADADEKMILDPQEWEGVAKKFGLENYVEVVRGFIQKKKSFDEVIMQLFSFLKKIELKVLQPEDVDAVKNIFKNMIEAVGSAISVYIGEIQISKEQGDKIKKKHIEILDFLEKLLLDILKKVKEKKSSLDESLFSNILNKLKSFFVGLKNKISSFLSGANKTPGNYLNIMDGFLNNLKTVYSEVQSAPTTTSEGMIEEKRNYKKKDIEYWRERMERGRHRKIMLATPNAVSRALDSLQKHKGEKIKMAKAGNFVNVDKVREIYKNLGK